VIIRDQIKNIKRLARKFPVVSVTGPRQSGKTTLLKQSFPKHKYVSLEDSDNRSYAENDPRGFLTQAAYGMIIDEVQRVPQLFSYIQTLVDDHNKSGMFILSGSQNFLLLENISQTLAGRVAILKLLPLSINELQGHKLTKKWDEYLFNGSYPRLYDKKIAPKDFYPSYIQTYVERDVKQMRNIGDLRDFMRFIRLCAGRIGQLLNLSTLAADCGISVNTAKSWISILEASYIIYLLPPHHNNYNRRLVKMPKLYFYDTGLACSLLGIGKSSDLKTHFLKGGLFENLVINEFIKFRFNHALVDNCYFWRDHKGTEIDLILEAGNKLIPIEIKAGETVSGDYFTAINHWNKISGNNTKNAHVFYGGNLSQNRTTTNVVAWPDYTTWIRKLNT
jgi:uncharacterized protein